MTIPLSKRLQACAGFVAVGDRVADIGCDHGYLGIHLLKNNIAKSVIAADINEMPLQSARKNALKFGVHDKMSFYLSDGARDIPRDFDTMVCAGMGADTIISILESASWLRNTEYHLILQCQSKTPQLRQYLSEQGWRISKETVLRDGRFLYTVMAVRWQPDYPRLTIGQWYFPPALQESASPELREYYNRLLFSLKRAINGRGENADPEMITALQELENTPALQWLKEETHDNCK